MDLDEALAEARALGRPSREVQIEVFDVLASAVERVRALHHEEFAGVGDTWPVCGSCIGSDEDPMPWPCPTISALDGEA